MMMCAYRLQIIEAPRSLKRQKSSSSRGPSKPQLQVITARQRVLSKLGLLHSSSLRQLVRIRPARAPGPHQSAIHSKSSQAQKGAILSRPPVSLQSSTVKHKMRLDHATAVQSSPSPGSKTSVRHQAAPHYQTQCFGQALIAKQSPSRESAAKVHASQPQQATQSECTPSQRLVEDDIDWGAGVTTQAGLAPPPPEAEQQHWTAQYLEGFDNDIEASRDRMLGRNVSQSICVQQKTHIVCSSNMCSTSTAKAPVKHGTAAWVEDDIQWD